MVWTDRRSRDRLHVGIVRDATGAVVPDVAVTVSGPALLTPRQTSSDAAGAYRILRLPPGDYTLAFARQGFEVPEYSVRVGLGFTANLDVTLTLDAQRAEVTVTAGSSALDRHSAASADACVAWSACSVCRCAAFYGSGSGRGGMIADHSQVRSVTCPAL